MPPFVFDPNLDEDEKNQGGNPSAQIASGASTAEAPASGASAQQGTKPLETGSHYQNLDKYLGANQGSKFAGQVAGKVGGSIGTAKENQAKAAEQFKGNVQGANYVPTSQDVNQALANPTSANASQFQDWMKQSYTAPKSLAEDQSSYNKFYSGVNQAQEQAKQLGTEAGRFSLLDSYYGKPQYGFGQKSLDNLLLQQGGVGRQASDLRNQAAQLKSQGAQTAKDLQSFAGTRAGEVEKSRADVNQALNQAQTQARGAIDQTLAQAQAARTGEQQAMTQALQGTLTRDQFNKLGVDPNQNLYGLNLGNYFSLGGDLTKEQVATEDQRSRLNALSQLAGTDQDYLGSQKAIDPAYQFDQSRFSTDRAARESAANQSLANAQRAEQETLAKIANERAIQEQKARDMEEMKLRFFGGGAASPAFAALR